MIGYLWMYLACLVILFFINWYFHNNPHSYLPEKLFTSGIIDTVIIEDTDSVTDCKSKSMRLTSGTTNVSIQYNICNDDYKKSSQKREQTGLFFDEGPYYKSICDHDFPVMTKIAKLFEKQKAMYKLDDMELLNEIASSIQHIPYTLVHPGSHDHCLNSLCNRIHGSLALTRPFKNWAVVGGCAANVEPFGVFSPVEMAYHHMADCDTRTLFAFSLMKAIGYDAVVLNSDIERHSILGVVLYNFGGFGESKFRDRSTGKDYTVWELTTPMPPRNLSPIL
ncbi:MAG: hypothetical protein IPP06_09520 [Saprospiraceae bacterium]|nr:hypothetical protein [Candidatus Vicinibacter affinis]